MSERNYRYIKYYKKDNDRDGFFAEKLFKCRPLVFIRVGKVVSRVCYMADLDKKKDEYKVGSFYVRGFIPPARAKTVTKTFFQKVTGMA